MFFLIIFLYIFAKQAWREAYTFPLLFFIFTGSSSHRCAFIKLKVCNKIQFFTLDCIYICDPAGMDASQMHLWDISYSVSETFQSELMCKSLRRFPGNWLKTSPQRRLWDLSGFLRDVFELHLRDCNSWPSN